MKNHYFQMDDRALWSELRSGSLIALEVIYRRYYSLLLNYGMKCTPDDDSFEKIFGNSDEDLRKKKALVQALSQLTSQQKHILYLRYIKGLSHKEVAEAMDMNVQSSMNLLSRSVSKLREILATHSIMCITFLQWMQII